VVRFVISHRQARPDRIGSTGDHGTRNPRARSGRVRRRIGTPKLTSTNADSVPMLIISSSSSTLDRPAISATTTPTPICSRTGVWNRGEVRETLRGSRPSRLIENTTRVRPSSSTMITEVRPTRIPTEITLPAQSAPTSTNAVVSEGEPEAARSS
jgi:hypothetical protein